MDFRWNGRQRWSRVCASRRAMDDSFHCWKRPFDAVRLYGEIAPRAVIYCLKPCGAPVELAAWSRRQTWSADIGGGA